MRKFIYVVVAILIAVNFSSCSDDDEEVDEYYVRYEVGVAANSHDAINKVGMNTPTGSQYSMIIGSTNDWQATYGPVQKGFKATLAASDFRNSTSHTFRISVSKNGGPFVVKYEGVGNYDYITYRVGD